MCIFSPVLLTPVHTLHTSDLNFWSGQIHVDVRPISIAWKLKVLKIFFIKNIFSCDPCSVKASPTVIAAVSYSQKCCSYLVMMAAHNQNQHSSTLLWSNLNCVLLFIENIAILFNYTQTKQKLQTASQTMCQVESPRVTVTRWCGNCEMIICKLCHRRRGEYFTAAGVNI